MSVIGIDVGGKKKGFHAAFLKNGRFEATFESVDPAKIVKQCLEWGADVVAVDAPSGWSQGCSSRKAERDLKLGGKKINCFATPQRAEAAGRMKDFYGWMFNGERLYAELEHHYRLFDGKSHKRPTCFETFPNAVVCGLAGKIVPAKPKRKTRREALCGQGYDVTGLSNIDFIDAALCAVAAQRFREGRTQLFGQRDEGFIVIPSPAPRPAHPPRD